MEEEKLMEHEAKKQKERNNEVGGQNFGPHTLSLHDALPICPLEEEAILMQRKWVSPKMGV